MDAVPPGINIDDVREYLGNLPNVADIHDLHVWAMSTTQVALTAHIIRNVNNIDDDFIHKTSKDLKEKFGIHHSTIQVENGHCELECQ